MTPEREMLEESIMLSEHFSLREMTRSGEAIERYIDNTPTPQIVKNMIVLCHKVLEPIRHRFGVTRITSGYRCRELNSVIGGMKNSQHMLGEAADIHVSDKEVGHKMFDYIREHLEYDQLLFERHMENGCCWLHVSYTTRRRNRMMARELRIIR